MLALLCAAALFWFGFFSLTIASGERVYKLEFGELSLDWPAQGGHATPQGIPVMWRNCLQMDFRRGPALHMSLLYPALFFAAAWPLLAFRPPRGGFLGAARRWLRVPVLLLFVLLLVGWWLSGNWSVLGRHNTLAYCVSGGAARLDIDPKARHPTFCCAGPEKEWRMSRTLPNIRQHDTGEWRIVTSTVYLAVVALAFFLLLLARGWMGRGYCRRCDYDLRATPERCPECGHGVKPPGGALRYWRNMWAM